MLSIASEIENYKTAETPSELNVSAELLVQFGAGLDEKSQLSDIEEMESLFDEDTPKVYVYRKDQSEGGVGFRFSSCKSELQSLTYSAQKTNDKKLIDVLNDLKDSTANICFGTDTE